jgi:FAD/FMN-containing dehydrogenase
MQPSSIEQMMVGSVDAAMGLGFGRSAVNTVWTADSAATIASVMDTFQRAPSPKSHIVVSVRGNLELPADSCFSRLDRGFVGCYAVWDEADQDAVNFAWAEQMSAKLQIGSSGCYINELDAFNQPERLRQAFSEQSLERLSALRHRYDPDGLFFDFPGRT